jgi:hypothetical protein
MTHPALFVQSSVLEDGVPRLHGIRGLLLAITVLVVVSGLGYLVAYRYSG